jgi:hypothetical protein
MIKRYLIIHFILTVFILSSVGLLHWVAKMMSNLPINIASVIWASLLTALAFIISARGLHGTPAQFSNAVLGGMMFKLLFSLGFITLVLFLSTVERKSFIASYFTTFFLMSGFEVYSLMNNLRPK